MPSRTFMVRVLVVVWAFVSIAIGVIAFAVVSGFYGDGIGAGALEGLETIPEAGMQMLGFRGAPIVVTIAYWIALAAAIVLAFRARK